MDNVRRRVPGSPDGDGSEYVPLTQKGQKDAKPGLKFLYSRNKINWYWVPSFFAFWLFLYFFISVSSYHSLPKPLTLQDEAKFPNRFIAERAEINLRKLTSVGPRVVGSVANEKDTVQFFYDAVSRIKSEMKPHYEIETDVQIASGSYIHWEMINMYQSIQNFVVKISPKDCNSTSYLLVNSHYDSVPGGPGAGDDGTMVVIMLEVLRVLAKSETPAFTNPIVFLFNGAEENPLQASHAFITQHKWAKNVKALINLDSAGSGGREILFQSGPNHPWLMKYYRKSILHPYASTIAEEMFQRHFIPSDTDFRIFRDHGQIPGLDMAHSYNGYVYHTKFDKIEIIPRGTYQSTGDNILALTKAIANAPELVDPSEFAEGHTIFFDVMGWFLVFYTETEGIILNVFVSITALVAIAVSFRAMAINSGLPLQKVLKKSFVLFGYQVVTCFLAVLLTILMAVFMDLITLPMSWFTHSWLILGLYFCPMFFGFGILPAVYISKTKDDRLPLAHRVQLLLHSHCLFLTFLTLLLTCCKIRSSFVLMMAVLFYAVSVIINLATKLHNQPLLWLIPHLVCQIFPFIFYAYLAHGFFVTFIPMTGRFGSRVNPELIIAGFSIVVSILIGGFLIPVLNMFKKSKTIVWSLLGITALFVIIAATPLGFPYRAETSVQRFSILHTRRVFHDVDTNVRRNESGYYILPQDRRTNSVKKIALNMTLAEKIDKDCDNELFCGLPLYNHRWHAARKTSLWIPAPDPAFSKVPNITVLAKKMKSKTAVRYEMELSGPDHMTLFFNPVPGTKITAWSFHETPLRLEWSPPFFVYFSYGVSSKPLKFFLEFERKSADWSTPGVFEVGVGGHWTHHDPDQTEDFKKFLASFPKWVDVQAWMSSYESWLF